MKVTDTIFNIGINDKKITLFEGQFPVENGMAYNSYIILDEKIAVMDTVEEEFGDIWIENIEAKIDGRKPDYLVVQHMEPDHSSNIQKFVEKYPEAVVVSNKKAFDVMFSFFREINLEGKTLVVGEGDTLNLGTHELCFVLAPMVHWPEVMVTYDKKDKVLFSADGFGKFGTSCAEEEWIDEARRYYFGIVGKFGAQVQALLNKASILDIHTICPLHGPILKENLGYYLDLYDKWSKYQADTEGVLIAYTSVYGNTRKAVEMLAENLKEKNCVNVELCDLTQVHISEAVEKAFKYDKIVLATTTYNGDIFPQMKFFLTAIADRNFQNRKIGLIENGAWAPTAAKVMTKSLENCKKLEYIDNSVKIKASLSEENIVEIEKFADEIIK